MIPIRKLLSWLLYEVADRINSNSESKKDNQPKKYLGMVIHVSERLADNLYIDFKELFEKSLVDVKLSDKPLKLAEDEYINIDGRTFSVDDVERITSKWAEDGIIR